MRKLLLLVLLTVCKFSVFASHIVGGEFELLHIEGFQYRLNMIQYFDELNGNTQARDPNIVVSFFRKSDNRLIRNLTLTLTTQEGVPYTNSDCDDGQIVTSRLLYTNTIFLGPNDFSDPEGYYIAWQRCCRNYTITNIFSDPPDSGGIFAGQTFYLEFPPVTVNGEEFINSTPRLFPPLRDYGCINNFYFADFGGIDDDGDSLTYSLVTPLNTVSGAANPPVVPGPYPEVIWQSGFGLDNIVGGMPDMEITDRGVLTVTPQFAGLYVFAVKVEEFRDGVKHGEMRRDFQMLVVTDCGSGQAPNILAREQGESQNYNEGTTLNFAFDDEEKCVDILVTDPPTNVGRDTVSNVGLRAIPINFNAQLEGIEIDFSENQTLRNELDTARFTVCFPDCPFTRGGFYQIGIIALDGSCPQPALDTVIVSLNVPPPPNQTAFFRVDNNIRTGAYILPPVTSSDGGVLEVDIGAFDNDGDSVELTLNPIGFDLENVGISFSNIVHNPGEATTKLTWSYDCNAENLNLSGGRDIPVSVGLRKAFDFIFTSEDFDQCEFEDPRNLLLTLLIDFPDQSKPTVFESSRPDLDYLRLNYQYGQTIDLNIRANDLIDRDNIGLIGRGGNFNFNDVGASFANIDGPGNPGVSSKFLWDIPCPFETEIDSFRLEFFVEDFDDCQLTNVDTLLIDLILSPPPNTPPTIFVNSLNEVDILQGDSISVLVGEPIELNIRAIDSEGDTLLLNLFDRNFDDPFEFEGGLGIGSVSSSLIWTPECSDLTDPGFTRNLELNFTAIDKNCYDPQGSSYQLKIHVEDINAGETDILPPNYFSPNGDEVNEFFGMYMRNPDTNELENILPIDNCAGQFERVLIFNRWGREVFSSNDRDFRWNGDGVPSGVYFYQVKYTNREYRGSVSVMY